MSSTQHGHQADAEDAQSLGTLFSQTTADLEESTPRQCSVWKTD